MPLAHSPSAPVLLLSEISTIESDIITLFDYRTIYEYVILVVAPKKNKAMQMNITLNRDTYLHLLLMVGAAGLLGLTGCSTAGRAVGQNRTGGYVQIQSRTYNSESRSFDRPWPFGPESNQQ